MHIDIQNLAIVRRRVKLPNMSVTGKIKALNKVSVISTSKYLLPLLLIRIPAMNSISVQHYHQLWSSGMLMNIIFVRGNPEWAYWHFLLGTIRKWTPHNDRCRLLCVCMPVKAASLIYCTQSCWTWLRCAFNGMELYFIKIVALISSVFIPYISVTRWLCVLVYLLGSCGDE